MFDFLKLFGIEKEVCTDLVGAFHLEKNCNKRNLLRFTFS